MHAGWARFSDCSAPCIADALRRLRPVPGGLDANKVACKDSSSRLDVVCTWQVGCDRLVGVPFRVWLSLSRAAGPCCTCVLQPHPARRLGQAVIAGHTSADVRGDSWHAARHAWWAWRQEGPGVGVGVGVVSATATATGGPRVILLLASSWTRAHYI